jgi:hypothetical protein
MSEPKLDLKRLSHEIVGLIVSELDQPAPDSVVIRFTNGAEFVLRSGDENLGMSLTKPRGGGSRSNVRSGPTPRQREYLQFIMKYMNRFGVAPAEADIQRHFLVSAPSVNQMIRVLERRGFIERDRHWAGQAVPRSIRVLWEA